MFEIIVEDIPEEGLEIEADEGVPWLRGSLRGALADAADGGMSARLLLRVSRIDGTVEVDGSIEIASHPRCDRCLETFSAGDSMRIHSLLAPKYESERQRRLERGMEEELVAEDMEFAFYEGDRFDLAELVREQMVLAGPMKRLCRDDCAGLCQRCGKNLNEGPCGCPPEEHSGSFEALKGLKAKSSDR